MPETAASVLPNAPDPQTAVQTSPEHEPGRANHPGSKIGLRRGDPRALDPSQTAERLTAGDKIELSLRQQITPFAFTTQLFSAGYEHLHDGHPKFGSDKAGFGERLGAAAIRQGSQSVFADGLFAAALHEDPRFYRMGTGSIKQRAFYAASRTWRTRTDAGNPAINYARLGGYAAAQMLTLAYYPEVSANWTQVSTGYAWSLFGNVMGNQYHEFWPDILQHVFHRTPKQGSLMGVRNP